MTFMDLILKGIRQNATRKVRNRNDCKSHTTENGRLPLRMCFSLLLCLPDFY